MSVGLNCNLVNLSLLTVLQHTALALSTSAAALPGFERLVPLSDMT